MSDDDKIELVSVKSSNIDKIGHNAKTQELRVQFKGGGIYAYDSVPEEVHQELLGDGTGIGGRFHKLIRDQYKTKKLK
jgi:hypothetical protein